MRWKALGIVTAAVLALPFAALADNPPAAHAHGLFLAGSVVSADSGHVMVDVLLTGKNDQQLDGKQVSVAITADTKIDYGKGQSSIDPGDLVGIHATAADASLSTLTARKIHVACNCHWTAGKLTAISPGLIRVNVAKTGPYDKVLNGNEVKFDVDSSTKFVEGKDKKPITIGDLSIGDTVGVMFSASGFFRDPNFKWQDATFTARLVHLHRDKGETSTPGADGAPGTNP